MITVRTYFRKIRTTAGVKSLTLLGVWEGEDVGSVEKLALGRISPESCKDDLTRGESGADITHLYEYCNITINMKQMSSERASEWSFKTRRPSMHLCNTRQNSITIKRATIKALSATMKMTYRTMIH